MERSTRVPLPPPGTGPVVRELPHFPPLCATSGHSSAPGGPSMGKSQRGRAAGRHRRQARTRDVHSGGTPAGAAARTQRPPRESGVNASRSRGGPHDDPPIARSALRVAGSRPARTPESKRPVRGARAAGVHASRSTRPGCRVDGREGAEGRERDRRAESRPLPGGRWHPDLVADPQVGAVRVPRVPGVDRARSARSSGRCCTGCRPTGPCRSSSSAGRGTGRGACSGRWSASWSAWASGPRSVRRRRHVGRWSGVGVGAGVGDGDGDGDGVGRGRRAGEGDGEASAEGSPRATGSRERHASGRPTAHGESGRRRARRRREGDRGRGRRRRRPAARSRRAGRRSRTRSPPTARARGAPRASPAARRTPSTAAAGSSERQRAAAGSAGSRRGPT